MRKKLVPDDVLIPIGAQMTRELGSCADSWSDSEITRYHCTQLPMEYRSVPVDELRRMHINIRKKGTEGYRTDGKGPSVGWKARKAEQEARQGKLF